MYGRTPFTPKLFIYYYEPVCMLPICVCERVCVCVCVHNILSESGRYIFYFYFTGQEFPSGWNYKQYTLCTTHIHRPIKRCVSYNAR